MQRAGCGVLPGALALALAAMTVAGAQTPPNVEELLVRVGERVAEFYKRAENVICIETSRVTRRLQKLAGRIRADRRIGAARRGGKRSGAWRASGRAHGPESEWPGPACTGQERPRGMHRPQSPVLEPLAFLLPAHRSEYQFRTAGTAKDRNRPVLMIDFASVDRRSNLELIEDPGGHDDCFDWTGPVASRGRLWVDATTYDVVRVERGLPGPVDVKVPALIQRRHHLDSWVLIARDDLTIRYKAFAFSNPDEVLLLPESIDSLTMVQGGLQSMRRTQTFSDYKRFVTGGRVLQ